MYIQITLDKHVLEGSIIWLCKLFISFVLNRKNFAMASGTVIHTRQGRPPKWLTYSFDQCADRGFQLTGAYIDRVKREWDTLTLDQQAEAVNRVLPLALKRIPDKIEQKVLSYNVAISEETASKMLELANRNLLIYNELDVNTKDVNG